jgi:hypothetical protein
MFLGFHSGDCLLSCDTALSCGWITRLRQNTLPPGRRLPPIRLHGVTCHNMYIIVVAIVFETNERRGKELKREINLRAKWKKKKQANYIKWQIQIIK